MRTEVLGHGFVRLVDVMGGDERVVEAARISYGDGTRTTRQNAGLINYLMRHDHGTPFEMVVFAFHLKLPIFVARQLQKHRIASSNELSGRYSILPDEMYRPEVFGMQSPDSKQGTGEPLPADMQDEALVLAQVFEDDARHAYQGLLGTGASREQARIVVPVSTFTELHWQVNLRSLFNFLRLRLDWHAQYEIRVYAEAIAEMVKAHVPLCWAAFEEYVLRAVSFSDLELEMIKSFISEEDLREAARAMENERGRSAGVEFLRKFNLEVVE